MTKYCFTLWLFLFFASSYGQSWDIIYLDTIQWENNVNDIHFINNDTGFAACWSGGVGDGSLFRTMNGGLSWSKTDFQSGLKQMAFISNDTGFVVGTNGKVFATFNMGNNWNLINILSPWRDLHSIYFKKNGESYIGAGTSFCDPPFACTEVLLYSNDHWQSFSSITLPDSGLSSPLQSLIRFNFLNEDTGFIISENNAFQTENGGDTWEIRYDLPYIIHKGIIFYPPSQSKLFLGGFGDPDGFIQDSFNFGTVNQGASLQFSINLGETWNSYYTSNPFGIDTIYSFYDAEFVNENIAYVVGGSKWMTMNDDGGIIQTTDGGNTWIDNYIPGNKASKIFAIDCPSSKVCYAGGYHGIILKNSNADLTSSVKSISKNNNSQLVLYPNPVTSTTTIEYQTTTTGKGAISIENNLGQTIQTLQITTNEKQTIDISNYPSGMYFVKCFNGKEMRVLKLIKQ